MPPIDLSRLPPAPRTRFAPSPTGYLHLGHVANAVWTWGIALASGGRVLLRIEDHDRGRCRPEYEQAILQDLDWLGLVAEPGPVWRQSDHDGAYADAVARLADSARIYGCRCSRADIARRLAADALEEWDELRYPGTCRELGIRNRELGVGLRAVLSEREVAFTDLLHGNLRQRPAEQCGDLLLRDATGNWTYQFAVVVDDLRQGVNLVIRGEDLLASTGRQILLGEMLGRASPAAFLHHPLIREPGGAKLSKRDGATGIREMRAAGKSPEEVLGEAAYLTGLTSERRPLGAQELARLFPANSH